MRLPNIILRFFFCIVLALVIASCTSSKDNIVYVSESGQDDNSGKLNSPFKTLERARDEVRFLRNEKMVEDTITINISDGYYALTKPIQFDERDIGPVIYQAEKGAKPIFSGAIKLNDIDLVENGLWKIQIPDNYRKQRFDQLYVNGNRAALARNPNEGYFKIKGVKEYVLERGTGRAPERATQKIFLEDSVFRKLQILPEGERSNLRFGIYHKWDFTLRFIDSLDADSMAIVTTGKGMKPWNRLTAGKRIYFENYLAALDSPGEWYSNSEGFIFYHPKEGETIDNTEIYLPVLQEMVVIKGGEKAEDFVSDITFDGLSFMYSGYGLSKSGFEPNQAAVVVGAAISIENSRNINFLNCEIAHTGQHALWYRKGCSESVVRGNYLHDLGGGGIYLGDTKALKNEGHTNNILIENNILQTGGRDFPPAVGIWVGHSSDINILHNDIGNFYYTGISVGWVWGYAPSLAKRNVLKYNRIHHIGWDKLSDMAAVYTLGTSEGTEVSNNLIHDIHAYSYGGWGLYTDEGSSFIKMENNLVYNTKTGGFHQHYGKENVIRNNILAFADLYQVQATRVEEHRSFNFENNIVVFDQGVVLQGPWTEIDVRMDRNLYYNISEDEYSFSGLSFKEWKKSGHDVNSIIDNPLFSDPGSFNFSIQDSSVVKSIGFTSFDYTKAGVYGDDGWLNKSKLPKSVLDNWMEIFE